jgi:hypothetical protein
MPVYALVAGNRLLIKESAGLGESRCDASGWDVTTMVCKNISLEQEAAWAQIAAPETSHTGDGDRPR